MPLFRDPDGGWRQRLSAANVCFSFWGMARPETVLSVEHEWYQVSQAQDHGDPYFEMKNT